MPTLTLQDKVQDYVGTVTDTNALSSWLTNGVRVLTNLIPEHKAYKYSADTAVTTAGLSVVDKRVLKAHKNSYGCRLIDPRYKAQVQDSSSLHYANSTDPAMLFENGKIYIYPNGGSVSAITYPTALYTTETPIANFPEELEDALVLRTAVRYLLLKVYNAISAINTLSTSTVTVPTAPSAPLFTYTDAVLGTYTATTITALATAPVYTKNTSPTISFTNADAFINTDEDVELANAELSQIKTKLENFQMEMYNELNEFNSQSLEYNAELQKKIEQAKLDQQRLMQLASETASLNLANEAKELERQIGQYASSLQRYQSEIQSYASQINTIAINIQKSSTELQGYIPLIQTLKAEYNEILQGYLGA